MDRFDGRWLRRVLAVGLVATLPVVVSSTPVGAAGNGCPDGGTWTIRWTGAAGDGYWEKQANWEPVDGVVRTPQPADRVCIDTDAGGGVIAGTTEMGSASTVVAEVAVTSGPEDPPVVITGATTTFTADTIIGPGAVVVNGTTVRADLRSMHDLTLIDTTVFGDLEMAPVGASPSQLAVEQNAVVEGSMRVQAVNVTSGQFFARLTDVQTARFEGPISLDGLGAVGVVGGHATITEDASLSGLPQIFLFDASVDHQGPFKAVLQGTGTRDLVIEGVGPGAVLLVQRSSDIIGGSVGPITVEIDTGRIEGTMAVTGQPGPDGPVDRLRGSVAVRSSGSLFLDGIDFAFGSVISEGTIRMDRTTVRSLDAGPSVLINFGRMEIGARQGTEVDPLRASAVFTESAELLNFGEVVAVDPSAELTLGGYTNYDGEEVPPAAGTLRVPVSAVIPVAHMPLFSGAGEPLTVPWLAWGPGGLGVVVDGVTESAAGRVVVEGLLRDVGSRRLVVAPGDGYHPCAGERWPVATFDRSALGYRLPTGGTTSVPGAQRSAITTSIFGYAPGSEPGWSVVASDRPGSVVATVTGTSSAGCSTPAGGRFVSALYVEGTGRVPTDAEYALRAGRSSTAAGRTAQARVVLKGSLARDHVIDEQYRRILDRPAHANAYAIWGPRLAGRWTPDQLRATLYGSTEFWNLNGKSLSSVTNAVYQRELGRSATAAERSTIAGKVSSGTKREAAFAAVMRTAEVDITTGGAMIERWWAREATPLEAFYVGAQLYRGDPEAIVAADLAAALPLN